jgi:primosomal protein N'
MRIMPETQTEQSYQLRDYQEELIQEIFAEWSTENRRVLVQSPTGSGKTKFEESRRQKAIAPSKKAIGHYPNSSQWIWMMLWLGGTVGQRMGRGRGEIT